MEDGHGLLFGDGQAAAYKAPVFFGFAHAALLAYGQLLNGVEELLYKMERGGGVVGLAFLYLEGEERVVENAATYHEFLYGREPLAYAAVVGGRADVTVIDDLVVQEGKRTAEGVEVHLSGVLLATGPGVDGDIEQGVVI